MQPKAGLFNLKFSTLSLKNSRVEAWVCKVWGLNVLQTSKLYITSTLNIDLISFTFHDFLMKIHSKLNKFRIKKTLDCYIVSNFMFLFEIQVILPETSPFSSAQMAVLSSFFSNVYM